MKSEPTIKTTHDLRAWFYRVRRYPSRLEHGIDVQASVREGIAVGGGDKAIRFFKNDDGSYRAFVWRW